MITLENISKTYKKDESAMVQALKNVSLPVGQGEFLAIVGPSGSGKSTLMNIMGLLDRPDEGSYLLDNREVSVLTIDELAQLRNQKIGFVFQTFHLLPKTSALENVELPLVYSDRTDLKDRAQRALEKVGLANRARHYPSELSGGQQQRVAIARALVNDPDIIFADEPTGNLDTRSSLEIMALFQALNRQGKTLVLITHDQDLAQHTQRIVRIVDGEIVGDDPVAQPKDAEAALQAMPAAPAH